MAHFNDDAEAHIRKRKQEDLQYNFEQDQKLFEYYQQSTSFYNEPSTSSSSNKESQPFLLMQPSFIEENKSFSQYQPILDFDDPSFRSQNPLRPLLHLGDLDNTHQQRELIQSWTMENNTTGNNTPSFFTPGFLESLQEADEKVSHDFHFNTRDNWNNSQQQQQQQANFIESQSIMIPEKQNNKLIHLLGQPNQQSSTPPSPIPNNIITNTSSVSSTSSTSSPPPPTTGYLTMEDHSWLLHQQHRYFDENKLKPIIRNYLADCYVDQERSVIILTSKVAQKSYGTEKRFLCPPPTAILVGKNWWTSAIQTISECNPNEVLTLANGDELYPPKLNVSITTEIPAQQSGQIEWHTVSGKNVGLTGNKSKEKEVIQHPSRFRSSAESRNTDWYHNHEQEMLVAGKCVSKNLFINDADEKRKRVEALVKIQLANGIHLGNFISKGIKVISKPSKKRQSVKNMELCIHHGTTVSLFNRIRSQTVSTKYLGVSSSSIPGQSYQGKSDDTCFVARTTSWDPFIIWIVDTSQTDHPTPPLIYNKSYPPPPALAFRTSQVIPIHYNQPIVLQCLTTGLVSPVMVIRKVDKASTVVGGTSNLHLPTDHLMLKGGGEFGDEVLGDPVSQLQKVALQIVQQQPQPPEPMMPRYSYPVNYLACLNDMVGMHKTTEPRKPVNLVDITSQEDGKVVRKRRVSMEQPTIDDILNDSRHRMNSFDEYYPGPRKSSMGSRRGSLQHGNQLGSYWQEDVSDVAVWTIVGTDSESYNFYSPSDNDVSENSMPFPSLTMIKTTDTQLSLHGENFSRDLQVWFGDIKAIETEYHNKELISCKIPPKNELQRIKNVYDQIPLLLVRGDGTICKTNKYYQL